VSLIGQLTETEIPALPQYRPGLEENLESIFLRLPPDVPSAPPYPQNQVEHPEGKDYNQAEIVNLAFPLSSDSINCQESAAASMCAHPRDSTTGSMASVPTSALSEDTALWNRQQHCQRTSQELSSNNAEPEKADFKSFQHNHQARSDGDDQQSPRSDTLSITNSTHESPSFTISVPNHDTPESVEDDETQKHKALLHKRVRVSSTRKIVKISSMVVGGVVLLGMILILKYHTSKMMARAGFTACTTMAYLCVGAGMWAADRTMVETFIAMNLVVVYAIFLNGQVDVFLNYATNS
jgi:hypothetical protein